MEVDVLLAGDGESVARGGIVAPVLDDSDYAFVHSVAEATKESRGDDVPFFIDRDFDDDIAFEPWRTDGARDNWIRIDDRVCWSDFVSVGVTVSESSVGGAGCAVAGWRESTGHGGCGGFFGFRWASIRKA